MIKISEIVIACFNIDSMFSFYMHVFDIQFREIKIPQGQVYIGLVGEISLTLCPAALAGIKASDNLHQVTFQIDSIKETISKVEQFGGTIFSDLETTDHYSQIAIRDVDGNSMILKELIEKRKQIY